MCNLSPNGSLHVVIGANRTVESRSLRPGVVKFWIQSSDSSILCIWNLSFLVRRGGGSACQVSKYYEVLKIPQVIPNIVLPGFTNLTIYIDLVKLKGTVHPQNFFLKYVMLRTLTLLY